MAAFPLPSPGTSNQPYQFATIPSNFAEPSKLFLKNTTAAYVYDGSTVTKVTSENYPVLTVWGCAYLDGRIYVMAPDGTIYGSDIFDPLTWQAATSIAAKSEGDQAVALVRHLVYLIAFKQFSSEFFYDAGLPAPGSPMAPMLNAFMEVGCATGGSIAFSDNTVFFMSESKAKGRSISRMDGFENKVISTVFIDRQLNASDLSEVYAFVVKKNGHVFYVLTLVDREVTLVYDDISKEWHRWTYLVAGDEVTATLTNQDYGAVLATTVVDPNLDDGDPVTITYPVGNPADPTEYTETLNITKVGPNQFSFMPTVPVVGTEASYVPWTETFFPAVFYTRGTNTDLLLALDGSVVYEFKDDVFQDDGAPIDLRARTALDDWGVMRIKRFNRLELVGDIEDTTVLVRFNDVDYRDTGWSQYRQILVTDNRAQLSALGSARRRAHEFRHTGNTPLRMVALEADFDVGAR